MKTAGKTEALSAAKEKLRQSKACKRLMKLFDDGAFTELDAFVKSKDGFAEVMAAHGTIDGLGVYAFAQNSEAAGGAMSKAQAAKIKKVYDLALKTGEPVVAVYDSVGGRLDEGTDLLAAYGDVLKYSSNLSGVVPQIAVVLGNCFGTQALIAACADVVILSEQAAFSLDTAGTDASAAKNAQKGIAHLVAKDEDEALTQTRKLLSMLPQNNLSTACIAYDSISAQKNVTDRMTASEAAFAAVDQDSLIALQPSYAAEAKTALATVNGTTVGVIALDGKVLSGHACAKAARFVRFCDAFSMPVLTFVDAEQFGCIKGAAKLTSAYAEATTAKVTVITGEAYGAVYIAAAGTGAAADVTYAWTGASVSALAPEAAAVIMLGDDFGGQLKGSQNPQQDKAKLLDTFKAQELTAMKAAENGYVDDVFEAAQTREKVMAAVEMLCNKRVTTLPKKHNNLFI